MALSAKDYAGKPVLIIGGSGVVGSTTARVLRQLHPDLPITIGGRDLGKAETVAREIGSAEAAIVDLDRRDLGQDEGRAHSAIAVFVKDHALNSIRYAQDRGIGHVGISTGVYEMGPELALFVHRPAAAPTLMDSTWLAGAALLPALHFVSTFEKVDSINIVAVLDPRDLGGPAADADYARFLMASPHAQYLKDGRWTWTDDEDARRIVRTSKGKEIPVTPYSPFDMLSLSAATQARSIRFDFAMVGEADSDEDTSTEIIIEIEGTSDGGRRNARRWSLVHPNGQAPVTATGVAVAVEHLLGLVGVGPPAPGLYLPELLIEPDFMLERLKRFGMRIQEHVSTDLPAVPA